MIPRDTRRAGTKRAEHSTCSAGSPPLRGCRNFTTVLSAPSVILHMHHPLPQRNHTTEWVPRPNLMRPFLSRGRNILGSHGARRECARERLRSRERGRWWAEAHRRVRQRHSRRTAHVLGRWPCTRERPRNAQSRCDDVSRASCWALHPITCWDAMRSTRFSPRTSRRNWHSSLCSGS